MSRKLLFSVTTKDCDEQHFTVGGNGGSGKDTSNTGVRFIHRPSGAVGESREERSQVANRRKAWDRMANSPTMQKWLRVEAARRQGKPTVEELVEADMAEKNLKIEMRQEGKWVPYADEVHPCSSN